MVLLDFRTQGLRPWALLWHTFGVRVKAPAAIDVTSSIDVTFHISVK